MTTGPAKYKSQVPEPLKLRRSFVLLAKRVDISKQKPFLSSVHPLLRASTNGPTQYQGLRGPAVGYGRAVDRPQPTTKRSIKGCERQQLVTQKELTPSTPANPSLPSCNPACFTVGSGFHQYRPVPLDSLLRFADGVCIISLARVFAFRMYAFALRARGNHHYYL